MAKTVSEYLASMRHAIGGSEPATGISTIGVLNEALRELFGFHDWDMRKPAPASLNLVAGQSYVSLPADFGHGQLVAVTSGSDTVKIIKTTLPVIADIRGSSVVPAGFTFWVALSWPTQTTTTVAPAPPRLEIAPTPGSNATGAMQIVYRRGPAQLTTDAQVPNIPVAFESALETLARARIMLREYTASDPDAQAELALAHSEMARLVMEDGAQETDVGVLSDNPDVTRGDCGPIRHFDTADIPR